MAAVRFTCAGHRAIRATHHKTLEVTRDGEIGERATCIIGVAGQWDDDAVRSLSGRVRVTLAAGDAADTFEAVCSPGFLGGRSLVFRRGADRRERTFAHAATKAASDLDRALVRQLAAGATLRVSIDALDDESGSTRLGTLYVVGLPIGNYDDLTDRARQVIEAVDLVVAEDTRRFRTLARDCGIGYREVQSFHVANEGERVDAVVARLTAGATVALVSDAGTPLVNDPGFGLVRRAIAEGVAVRPVPGPSAPIAALSVAGLEADEFVFAGYLARRRAERRRQLAVLGERNLTTIVFEVPHRLTESLADVAELLPGRRLCVARELTKIHEEIVHTSTDRAIDDLAGREPRGEYTLVIERLDRAAPASAASAATGDLDPGVVALLRELRTVVPTRVLADALAASGGIARRAAYDLVLALGSASSGDPTAT